jgi:hypothetical protein
MKTAEEEKENTTVRKSAGEWFLGSGIQEASGGVARYYFSDERERNAPLSTEITGYAISALVNLYKLRSETRYLDAACNAAVYLVNAWDKDSSAMPFEAEAEKKQSFFFDDGIIIRGLLSVWREFRNDDFLATAVKVGDSMARDHADGKYFAPIITMPEKERLPYEPKSWSRYWGCYQLKSALGWYELWEVTKEEKYLQLYRQMLETSLATHKSFLPGVEDEFLVMDRLHPECYFMEGLLPIHDEPEAAAATVFGIERVAGFVRSIGPRFLRSDVLAQLLRVRIFADQFGVAPLDETAAQHEVALMREFQSADSDPRLNGGFWFGRKNGKMLPFMNPVSTAFCNQALEMWEQRGKQEFSWVSMI